MKPTFEQWMKKVDEIIANKLGGLTSSDLADVCYIVWFEDGVTPKGAASRAIKNEREG